MKLSLRNFALAALLTVAGASFAQDGIQSLSEGWNFSTTRGNVGKGGGFSTAAPASRACAVNGDKLYVLNCSSTDNAVINVVDANTGVETGETLSLAGVTGGGYLQLSHIEMMGNDLIGTSATYSAISINVYKWTDGTGSPELWASLARPAGYGRFGENFAVYGDSENGKLLLTSYTSVDYPFAIFVYDVVNGVVNTEPKVIYPKTNLAGSNSTGSAIVYDDDTYIAISKDYMPTLVSSDGTMGKAITLSSKFGSSGKILDFQGKKYFIGSASKTASGYPRGVIDVVDITDGIASASKVFTFPEDADGLGTTANGQVVTSVDYSISEDGRTLNLFVLIPAQGVAMYTYTAPKTEEPEQPEEPEEPETPGDPTPAYYRFYQSEETGSAYLPKMFRTDLFEVWKTPANFPAYFMSDNTNKGGEYFTTENLANGNVILAAWLHPNNNPNKYVDFVESAQIYDFGGEIGKALVINGIGSEINAAIEKNFSVNPGLPIFSGNCGANFTTFWLPNYLELEKSKADRMHIRIEFNAYANDMTKGNAFSRIYAKNDKVDIVGPNAPVAFSEFANEDGEWDATKWMVYEFEIPQAYSDEEDAHYDEVGSIIPNLLRLENIAGLLNYSLMIRSIEFSAVNSSESELELNKPYISWNTYEIPEPVITTDKAHFAYNLKAQDSGFGYYDISFTSTGDAKTAYLVLTNVDTQETIEEEIGAVTKGENTYQFEHTALQVDNKYTWAIRVHNYAVDELKVNGPINVGGSRAGIATFTDPDYPEVLGYTIVGRTQNGGIDVYDPEGNHVRKAIYAGCEALGNTNTSSPMDATTRGTEAYLASWGDASIGVVAFDLAKELAEEGSATPYGVFEGTKAGTGLITNAAGEGVGSGTPCVGVWGKGEETTIITFDEDVFGNKLAMNVIGNAKTTSNAAQLIGNGFNGELLNTNVGVATTKGGFFASQIRGNGMEETTSGLRYFKRTEEGNFDSAWKIFDQAAQDATLLPSALAGIDVTHDESKIAVPGYDAIYVYDLTWSEEGIPSVSNRVTIPNPYGRQTTRANVRFDAAGNLHVTQQATGYYVITLPNEEHVATTAAPAGFTLGTVGVGNVAVEAENGEAVYYNLNGVRMNGNNLPAGIYVKVVGKKATKVVVK